MFKDMVSHISEHKFKTELKQVILSYVMVETHYLVLCRIFYQ